MQYNAILIGTEEPRTVRGGYTQYAGRFLLAVNNNTDTKCIYASQLFEPIPVATGSEIILDICERECNGKTYYNIVSKSSYKAATFPTIKREASYTTELNSRGFDGYSLQYFPEHAYEKVSVRIVEIIEHGRVASTQYEIEPIDDYTKVLNDNLVLENTQGFAETDYRRLIEALRNYLPIEEHPDKDTYSAREVYRHYQEVKDVSHMSRIPFQYGSDANHCICGHYIVDVRYCEYVSNKCENGIKKLPLGAIGNCCIKKMSWKYGFYTRLLSDIIFNCRAGKFKTERDISKKNGFWDLQMEFLQKCVLTEDEFERLKTTLDSRYEEPLNDEIYRILHHIVKFYEANYNKTFNPDTGDEL